ncbi:MAG: hypothetical protein CL840_09560 [Crocinitomicaceae bacterium]|nr:hypothetical protein [Crocinitomicaceae bacterium]|tara:strand:+ start:11070 stop:11648 length:579 start_codon:yes stop_codon:yes gene_type:complete
MNKLFLALAVISLGFFSSCNKCKDKTCLNSASCDKKTGDCSDVCLNGGTSSTANGACSCTEFYDGAVCDNEIRNDLAGSYSGTLEFDKDAYGTVTTISNHGTDATGQAFSMVSTFPGNETMTISIKGVLTAKDSITITEELIPISIPTYPQVTHARITGNGFYSNGKFEISFNMVTSPTVIPVGVSVFKGIK